MVKQLKRGLFIALYGINNLGKTTQAKMLVERLKEEGYNAIYEKYAAYSIEPSGPILNGYLREGNPYNIDVTTFQTIQVINRMQNQTRIEKLLESGYIIIAEDYTGTGLAWGAGAGVSIDYLKQINSHLLKEDVSFFFKGERFREAIETSHKHENDEMLTNKVAKAHQQLADEYKWLHINANDTIENIHEILFTEVCKNIINKCK